MFNAKPLKRVIDGKSYNTETATLIHEHVTDEELQENNPNGPNSYPYYQQLYRTRYGKFFFVLRNEPFQNPAIGEMDLQDRIAPTDGSRAIQWMEEHCNEKIEQFMEVPEAGDPSTTLTLRLDKSLKLNLNTTSIKDGISMNSWCVHALDGTVKVWRPEMTTVHVAVPKIPHGHGLSFRKGAADGILDSHVHEGEPHETHSASYKRGFALGLALKEEIAKLVNA